MLWQIGEILTFCLGLHQSNLLQVRYCHCSTPRPSKCHQGLYGRTDGRELQGTEGRGHPALGANQCFQPWVQVI